jgi:hypothetical protein
MTDPIYVDEPERWFLERVNSALDWARKKASRREKVYYRLRICALTFSTGVVITAATPAPRWSLAAIAAVGVLIEGGLQITGYREQMLSVMAFRSQTEAELALYHTRTPPYDDSATRLHRLVQRMEGLFRKNDADQISILRRPSSRETETTSFDGHRPPSTDRP